MINEEQKFILFKAINNYGTATITNAIFELNKANILMSPKRFGRMMNDHTELLESEGVYITSNRTGEGRFYHCIFREPTQEDLKED